MSKKNNPFIVITGIPGSGKTTIIHRVHEDFKWKIFPDKEQEYLYVEDFYSDMERWSFHHEFNFIFNKFKQQESIHSLSIPVCQDISAYDSYEVFSRNLFNNGLMSPRDFRCLTEFYNWSSAHLPFPDLIVHLKAPIEVVLERIRRRGRFFEQGISYLYLSELEKLYENWIRSLTFCPVMIINTTQVDIASASKQIGKAVDKITKVSTN
jgi:deoxyadenosine/deoxycytidine kinase